MLIVVIPSFTIGADGQIQLDITTSTKPQSSGNFISEMHTYTIFTSHILATFIKTSISQDSPKVIYDYAQPVFHIDRNVQTVYFKCGEVWAKKKKSQKT